MTIHTPIGDRMKQYENVSQYRLIKHLPTIIRIDGKAFHSYTKKAEFDYPFCDKLHDTMVDTMESLFNNIQNAVFAYTQSDEISILLKDYPDLNTEQWFDGKCQKIASVSASMATGYFNDHLRWVLTKSRPPVAFFDARVFQVPFQEVCEYFIWRQQDATRNSIQMLGRHHFSHREMHNKSTNVIQDMLMTTFGVNWNDLDVWKKRGTGVYKDANGYTCVDESPPEFTKNREFITQYGYEKYVGNLTV